MTQAFLNTKEFIAKNISARIRIWNLPFLRGGHLINLTK